MRRSMSVAGATGLVGLALLLLLAGCGGPATPPPGDKATPAGSTPAPATPKPGGTPAAGTPAAGNPAAGTPAPAGATPGATKPAAGTPAAGSPTADAASQPAIQAATADLARRRGVDATRVSLAGVEAVTWPDGSLGCPAPGQAYIQVVTPGWRVRLVVDGQTVVYHTNETGASLTPCPRQP